MVFSLPVKIHQHFIVREVFLVSDFASLIKRYRLPVLSGEIFARLKLGRNRIGYIYKDIGSCAAQPQKVWMTIRRLDVIAEVIHTQPNDFLS